MDTFDSDPSDRAFSIGCFGMIAAGLLFLAFVFVDGTLGHHEARHTAILGKHDKGIVIRVNGGLVTAIVSPEVLALVEKGDCVRVGWTEGRWTSLGTTNVVVEDVALPAENGVPRCVGP